MGRMKSDVAPGKTEELRPIVHLQIDALSADELPLIHRVLLQLKAEALAEKITTGLEQDGDVFDRLEETIADFRKKRPYQ